MLAELVELAPAGFEQVDGDGFVEFALYGAPGELPALATGPADIGGVHVEVSGTEVGDDWADRWRGCRVGLQRRAARRRYCSAGRNRRLDGRAPQITQRPPG